MDWKVRKALSVEEMFKLIFETCNNQAKGWERTSLAEGPAGQRNWRPVGLGTHGKLDLRKHSCE